MLTVSLPWKEGLVVYLYLLQSYKEALSPEYNPLDMVRD